MSSRQSIKSPSLGCTYKVVNIVPLYAALFSPPPVLQSPGSRSSRLFQVRHSTVVVHGEQLVIRKLVVVGVVSAEKSYIECLSVLKEVSSHLYSVYIAVVS